MPKISPFKDKDKKKRVVELYKVGLNLREIGEKLDRSHEWVRRVIKSYPQADLFDKE